MTAWPSMVRLDEAGFFRGMAVVSTTRSLLDRIPEVGSQAEMESRDRHGARERFDGRQHVLDTFGTLADERHARGDLGHGTCRAHGLLEHTLRLDEPVEAGQRERIRMLGAAVV